MYGITTLQGLFTHSVNKFTAKYIPTLQMFTNIHTYKNLINITCLRAKTRVFIVKTIL